ncbi:peptidoglycan-binding domain-containing protein [Actinoplanes sp. NPDC049548]|uniref:peptidoglycan-binding domain-containing protein n=1 Tax=Actinoplanes sp. NPDC049548 TaxID=3155152 RepID=UPI0034251F5D
MILRRRSIGQIAHRWAARTAILVVAAGSLIVAGGTAAQANGYTPAGCRKHAYGLFADWRFNCTLGENSSKYVKFAAYVQGMQIILKGYGYYTISVDGDFGNASYTGVRLYQNHKDLTSDGLVGKNTWTEMMDDLTFAAYLPIPGGPAYRYNSPGVIGVGRFDRGDYVDAHGHYGPWSYNWDGFGIAFGTNAPI